MIGTQWGDWLLLALILVAMAAGAEQAGER